MPKRCSKFGAHARGDFDKFSRKLRRSSKISEPRKRSVVDQEKGDRNESDPGIIGCVGS
jgi:hypothetical protein